MSIFRRNRNKDEDNVIPMNENGEIIGGKKKSKAGEIAKKVAVGVGCAIVGVITFIAVGAAVAYSEGNTSEDISFEPTNDSGKVESDGTGSSEDSSEESTVSTEE